MSSSTPQNLLMNYGTRSTGKIGVKGLNTSKRKRTVLFPAPVMPITLEEYEKDRKKKKWHY
jgi:hypothetical protein